MLKKLYKYDFRCSARKVLPLFIVYFVITGVVRLMDELDINHPIFEVSMGIFIIMFFGLTFGLIFYGFGTAIARFKKNLFSDEGYLMHTLPVKPWQHVTSKLLNAFTWGVICIIATIIGIILAVFSDRFFGDVSKVFDMLGEFLKNASAPQITLIILSFVSTLMVIITLSLVGFFWTALESSVPFLKKNGVAFAIGVGIFVILTVGSMLYEKLINGLIKLFDVSSMWQDVFMMSISIGLMVVLTVVFFIGTCKLMEKKLNLE